MLENTPNQPTKFRTKNWVEMNDDSRRTYNSSLCDYSDAYILVSGNTTITWVWNNHAARWLDERNKGVIFKNCALFTPTA